MGFLPTRSLEWKLLRYLSLKVPPRSPTELGEHRRLCSSSWVSPITFSWEVGLSSNFVLSLGYPFINDFWFLFWPTFFSHIRAGSIPSHGDSDLIKRESNGTPEFDGDITTALGPTRVRNKILQGREHFSCVPRHHADSSDCFFHMHFQTTANHEKSSLWNPPRVWGHRKSVPGPVELDSTHCHDLPWFAVVWKSRRKKQSLESTSCLGTQEKCSRPCRTLFRTLVALRAVVIPPLILETPGLVSGRFPHESWWLLIRTLLFYRKFNN